MEGIFRLSFRAMAADAELVLVADSAEEARSSAQAAIAEVLRIERRYSRYDPDSIVSKLNAAAGRASVPCDAEMHALLDCADKLYRVSDGLFDVTSGILRRAWDFRRPRVPDESELRPLLALVGWPRVQRDEQDVFLPEVGMEIDFGGFGKEYAADRAAAVLTGRGHRHGYVNLAGDLNVIGPRPGGTPWLVGIRDPREGTRLAATLPMVNGGLATSGDYERYFELGGRRYCHILNPKTGMPVEFWRSVSVVAGNATTAGVFSTLTMLREATGLEGLRESGLDYLAIDAYGTMHLAQNAMQASQVVSGTTGEESGSDGGD